MSELEKEGADVVAEDVDVLVPVEDDAVVVTDADDAAAADADDAVAEDAAADDAVADDAAAEKPVVAASAPIPADFDDEDDELDKPLIKAPAPEHKKKEEGDARKDAVKWFNYLWILGALLLLGGLFLGLTQCKKAEAPAPVEETETAAVEATAETVTLKVGASPAPHAEILGEVIDQLAAEGIDLKIIEYSDYVVPNTALDSGEIDANFFQHVPYLDDFNAENGTNLVPVLAVHFEPLTIYAGKSASLDDIAKGAKIAIPNDTTNEARALLLLEAQGLIKLKEGVGIAATPADVIDNPHDIQFVEAEAAALPRLLEDADFAVINGNFALSAGVDSKLALASEDAASEAANTYANVVVVKAGNENNPAIQKLVAALKSDAIRTFIKDSYGGAVVPVF